MTSTLTGVYDTDLKVFEHMTPKELAKSMLISKTIKEEVESYVHHLVKSKKLHFVSKLTESIEPIEKKSASDILKMWNDGKLKK